MEPHKTMPKTSKLVIIGDSAFAQVAYEYFTHDSAYEVVGFCVEQAFLKQTEMFGLPVVAFETLEKHFTPNNHSFFAALVYTQLNRLRTRLYQAAKDKGFTPASFISSKAQVWPNAKLGEHCFILENNVVQPFVTLGNNVVLWSGNHIGHHSAIGDHCFIGVNATLVNNIDLGDDCVIGAGALVTKSLEPNSVVKGEAGEIASNARRLHRVRDAS